MAGACCMYINFHTKMRLVPLRYAMNILLVYLEEIKPTLASNKEGTNKGKMFLRVPSFIFFTFSLANTVYSREKRSELCFRGESSIHEFTDQDLKGRFVDFNDYRDNILLIVNVATFCQYTFQYLALNNLQKKYERLDRCGLKILAIPCNQFAHQEPGNSAEEIYNGLKYVRPGRGFEPQMLMMKKRDVNGKNEDSLYTWLKVKYFDVVYGHFQTLLSNLAVGKYKQAFFTSIFKNTKTSG